MAADENFSDFQKMIRTLYEKRAQIDAAISNLIAASGALVPSSESGASFQVPGGADTQPMELPRGAFLGKSLPGAIKLFLSAIKKKQTVKEISAALREGGVETTSDSFENVLTGSLNRMKMNGELLRFKDGWALAEFYPEHLRRSLSHGGASKSKTANKKAKKAKKTAKTAKQPQETQTEPNPAEGLERKIDEYFRIRAGEWIPYKEVVAAHPAVKASVVALMLGKMAKKHGWEKSPEGKYRCAPANVQQMPKAG